MRSASWRKDREGRRASLESGGASENLEERCEVKVSGEMGKVDMVRSDVGSRNEVKTSGTDLLR
jgi:hypothetical protein